MGEPTAPGGNPVLRVFGLDTRARAKSTLRWVGPYMGSFLGGLFGVSILISHFYPVPLWAFLLALGLSGINLFFFLAFIRTRMGETPEDEPSDEDPRG